MERGGDIAIGQKHASLSKGERDAQAASTLKGGLELLDTRLKGVSADPTHVIDMFLYK